MLLPALSKARERAKAISCANQLKQMGLAFGMYAGDYDGYAPYSWNMDAYPRSHSGLLGPYAKSLYLSRLNKTYVPSVGRPDYSTPLCPSQVFSYASEDEWLLHAAYCGGYAMNLHLGYFGTKKPNPMVRISAVKKSSKTLCIAEAGEKGAITYDADYWSYAVFRHNRLMNALLCDGHVETRDMITYMCRSSGTTNDPGALAAFTWMPHGRW
jgi:prepilin-type processing-associated H-X9-DG protein